MTIKLGIDKKGQNVEFDLEESNNICIVGNVHSDKLELAEKIKEQYDGPVEWIKPEDVNENITEKEGLIIIEDADNIEETDTLVKIIEHPIKTIIITEKFDEETIPDIIIKNIDVFFVGYIRSIPNYATHRLELKKSTMYLGKGEFIVSRNNYKERKVNIDIV